MEKNMKKQLLIAAVAATMASVATADISMTGNANFEYKNTKTSGTAAAKTSLNTTNTEVNLVVVGAAGDTKIITELEFNTHGSTSTDVEEMYITTKLGDVSAKLGNYDTPTTSLLGEIDNGSRATNKMTFSYKFDNGVKVYAGNSGTETAATKGHTEIDNSMFIGVKATVGKGWVLQAKKNESNFKTGTYGSKFSLGVANTNVLDSGFGLRLEQANTKNNGNALFGNITGNLSGDMSNIAVGYAWIRNSADYTITEDDSSVFAIESNNALSKGNQQIMGSMKSEGTTYTAKIGKIKGETNIQSSKYYELDAKRALAGGMTLAVTYTKSEAQGTAAGTDQLQTKAFEVDLSVKF
jgi:hypothetical protein